MPDVWEECDVCNGTKRQRCMYCIEPDTPGRIPCEECFGTRICQHCEDGACPECEGRGEVECPVCDSGSHDCHECAGNGGWWDRAED